MNFISITHASKMSGKSVSTIRRWIKEKVVVAEKSDDGKWLLDEKKFHEYLITLSSPVSNGRESSIISRGDHVDHFGELSKALRESLHRERNINDELRKQIQEKDQEILKLTHEMKSMLSKSSLTGVLSRWVRF